MRKNQKKMKIEGKALSVFSFIFAAGSATGMLITVTKLPQETHMPVSGLFFLLSVLSVSISAYNSVFPETKITDRRKVISSAMLAAAFFCSGIYSSLGYNAFNIGQKDSDTEYCGKENNSISIIRTSASKLKRHIDSIPYKERYSNALVKALVTGDKSDLDKGLKESFRKSGASHLLALSGMHLGIIYLIISRILSFAGNSPVAKKYRSIATICSTGFYTLLTGAGPSIVRAFLFICINETAKCLYRKSNPANTFCTALLIQLVFSPESILSAGFQLSYLAMAGIYFLYPSMKKWYGSFSEIFGPKHILTQGKGIRPMQRLWNTASLSISCQIFTAPAVWIYFHSFPTYFIITNLLAIPITTATISLGIAVLILDAVGICPGFILSMSETTIKMLIFCIETIGSL